MSGRVKELESKLDTKLFVKDGRGMALTAQGRQLVTSVEPLLNEIDNVLMSTVSGDSFAGNVKLGCGEIAALSCLGGLLSDLTAQMPRVNWNLDVDLTINLRQKLESSQLDLALLVGPIDGNFLESHSIGKVKLTWMASKALLKDSPGPELARFRIWSLSKPSYQYQITHEVIKRLAGPAPSINTCNNVKTMIEVVKAGAGIAMLPENLVRQELKCGELVSLSKLGMKKHDHVIEFFVVKRRLENDPLLCDLFKKASQLRIR